MKGSTKKQKKTNTLKVPVPKDKFRYYLECVGVALDSELEKDQAQKVFFRAIQEFKTGELSLDELSAISHRIWWQMTMKDNKFFGTKLGKLLYEGGELSFYVRSATKRELGLTFIQFLGDILKYYEEKQTKVFA